MAIRVRNRGHDCAVIVDYTGAGSGCGRTPARRDNAAEHTSPFNRHLARRADVGICGHVRGHVPTVAAAVERHDGAGPARNGGCDVPVLGSGRQPPESRRRGPETRRHRGRTVQTVAPYASIRGGAGRTHHPPTANAASPLARIPASGGPISPVTQVTKRSFGHRFAQPLPDDRHFLFFAGGPDGGVYVGRLGDSDSRKVLDADAAVYAATGHLFFVRQGSLFAQRFDTTSFEVTGAPTLIAQDIAMGTIDRKPRCQSLRLGPSCIDGANPARSGT